jgi:hypothetical protein
MREAAAAQNERRRRAIMEAAYFDKRFNAESHRRSGSRSPDFASSMINLASVTVVGSLRSTNPRLSQGSLERRRQSRDVFWPEPTIGIESNTIGHEAPR